jgi:replicative DNA helicase
MPGAGKSALAVQVAVSALMLGKRVLYISPEMDSTQLVLRMLACFATISGLEPVDWSRAHRQLAEEKAAGGVGPIASAAMHFSQMVGGRLAIDCESQTDADACQGIEMCSGGDALCAIDYVQMLGCDDMDESASEHARVSAVTKKLARSAKDAGVSVLALSSLNREALKKGEIGLEAFKGSGDLGYYTVGAMILHAPDGPEGRRELHVVKHRWGALTGDSPIMASFDGANNFFRF